MQLSIYFRANEFTCHDGTPVPAHLMPNLQRLVDTVTLVRHAAGVPLNVISGFRTPSWNARVGGAVASTHLDATGGDFRPGKGMTTQGLHDLVLELWREGNLEDLGGLGLYLASDWVHIDVRKAADGHLRRWNGRGMGSEPG